MSALIQYGSDEFVVRFIYMDDVWVHLYMPETKQQLKQWRQQTALHLAAELGYAEVAEVLLSFGADLSVPEKLSNGGGRKALYIAARGSYTAIVDMLIKVERNQIVKPLMESEADPSDPQCSPECVRQMERQAEAQQASMRDLLWTLSKNYLEPQDWKKLARHFGFTEEHIKAIERHYTGKSSYKEHGYRMLLIWLQGLPSCKHPLKELYEALTAINKRDVAERIRRKAEERPTQRRSCRANRFCAFCTLM
ncbi:ankyrin repeat and death domain-containing protein 1A [Trichonephila clavipes]|uniref:Ankyrin repeat and death domain-containing protein 1A n=1 Tax=Trichonephila clavipes TaxID=2585209 RepID=A0A8X6WK45_TRICX|nr:ankyrin repeat and death domain-containing protein 1A [Trichonephila clavipes]